ncbi:unnamed protein product [Notodromas monacha]|uniref:Uncharacterized protein n=1 Tax=Notodromas monacha TaxID=399045 RepID=A0A7R9BHH3_9CRUS|nr:unnamed protein product [Notodromas monacha]CAG0914163.1 unnamed protein product [Notodromas monacha]
MITELNSITVVLIIAFGALIFILTAVVAKRQIHRHVLKSRKGPYVPIGSGASRGMQREVLRRLERVSKIKVEPKLLHLERQPSPNQRHVTSQPYYFRMKAIDDMKCLEDEILQMHKVPFRPAGDSLRLYFMSLLSGPFQKVESSVVSDCCDFYEHARFHPAPFTVAEYALFVELLKKMRQSVQSTKQVKTDNAGQRRHVFAAGYLPHGGNGLNLRMRRSSSAGAGSEDSAIGRDLDSDTGGDSGSYVDARNEELSPQLPTDGSETAL